MKQTPEVEDTCLIMELQDRFELADKTLQDVYRYAKSKTDDFHSTIINIIDKYREAISNIQLKKGKVARP